ncbi:MAG: hypothetical protein ABI426_07905 [Flavobacterium sp.]
MKRLSLITIIFLVIFPPQKINAQKNHLEPFADLFSIYNYQFEYYSIVREKLYKDLSDCPEIRFLTMPSFSPENVLQIDVDKSNQKYYLKFNIAETSLWYSEEKDKVKIKSFKKEIKTELAILVRELFKKAILNAHYKTEHESGLDGINYYFMVWDFGIKGGTIWSPDENTDMGELVEIGNMLIEFCKSEQVEFDSNLLNKVTSLSQKL